MINALYRGRLGNQLFIYATARTVAEKMGYRLQIAPIDGFRNTYEEVDGDEYKTPLHYIYRDYMPDMRALFANKRPRCIFFDAYLQDYAYFSERAADVRRWLYPGPAEMMTPNPNDVVMHIRLGDYVTPYKWAIDINYYTNALETVFSDREKLFIVTDEPDHPCLAALDQYAPTYYSAPPLEAFRFLVSAPRLVIGNSTFSWWAAFLSSSTIVAPLFECGYYFAPEYKNERYIVNEDRYTYVKNVKRLHEVT